MIKVKLTGAELPDAVLISEKAVGSDLGGKYVLLVGADNMVEQRYVELGAVQADGLVHIKKGLEGRETVIVNGLMFARPGLPVTPLTAEQFTSLLRSHGASRILFGTDWPWFGHTDEIPKILRLLDQAGFGEDEVRRVMRGNAGELLIAAGKLSGNERGWPSSGFGSPGCNYGPLSPTGEDVKR